MNVVDKSSRIPYYYQLAEILRKEIATHQEGAEPFSMPSEHDLVKQHSLSRATIRQALDVLEREGLIFKQKGRGTFASKPRPRYELTELIPTTDELERRGWVPSVQVISAREIAVPARVAAALNLAADDPVFELCRLRLGNEEPISMQWSYLPLKLYPGLLERDLTQSLTHLVETHYGIRFWKAREILRARLVTASESKHLHVSPQSPVIYMERITFAQDGTPLEFLESVWRSDRYDFEFTLARNLPSRP